MFKGLFFGFFFMRLGLVFCVSFGVGVGVGVGSGWGCLGPLGLDFFYLFEVGVVSNADCV